MHISELFGEHGKQEVRPRDFWLAVGSATLLLGGLGISFTHTGRVPSFPSWLRIGILLFIWGVVVVDFVGHGRKAFSYLLWIGVLGGTLAMGSPLVSALGPMAFWLENASFVMLRFTLVAPIDFKKRPRHRCFDGLFGTRTATSAS